MSRHYCRACGDLTTDAGLCGDCMRDLAACPECGEPIANGCATTEYKGREYHEECADIAAEADSMLRRDRYEDDDRPLTTGSEVHHV